VQFGAGEAPLLVVAQGGVGQAHQETLIPFAQEFIAGIDIAGKRVEMKLPAGMLELDAPLTDEEKTVSKQEAGGRKPK